MLLVISYGLQKWVYTCIVDCREQPFVKFHACAVTLARIYDEMVFFQFKQWPQVIAYISLPYVLYMCLVSLFLSIHCIAGAIAVFTVVLITSAIGQGTCSDLYLYSMYMYVYL